MRRSGNRRRQRYPPETVMCHRPTRRGRSCPYRFRYRYPAGHRHIDSVVRGVYYCRSNNGRQTWQQQSRYSISRFTEEDQLADSDWQGSSGNCSRSGKEYRSYRRLFRAIWRLRQACKRIDTWLYEDHLKSRMQRRP